MANDDHLARLMTEDDSNLSGLNFSGANLRKWCFSKRRLRLVDFSGANLSEVDLSEAILSGADLRKADLSGANFFKADLSEANLSEAILIGANLSGAILVGASLSGAILVGASLSGAMLVNTDLTAADLTGCHVYGVSAWGLKLDGAKQNNLVITPWDEPEITADNIEVAQFIYLLLHNQKIRDVIDTITSKVALILGRFTAERKAVLDALRDELRGRNYLPVLFDFEKPRNSSTLETVMLLARMARFVIADISDAKSVMQELAAIVPTSPSLPVQPIIIATQEEPGMFDFFRNFPWFLKVHRYDTPEQLLADLNERVIAPAEAKMAQLRG
jgi:Pentapeptide repeats (8 copies)